MYDGPICRQVGQPARTHYGMLGEFYLGLGALLGTGLEAARIIERFGPIPCDLDHFPSRVLSHEAYRLGKRMIAAPERQATALFFPQQG